MSGNFIQVNFRQVRIQDKNTHQDNMIKKIFKNTKIKRNIM